MRAPFLLVFGLTLLILSGTGAHAAGAVRVEMHDGVVSVSSRGATLREILDEWARAGHTTIVNADKIVSAAPITLELTNVKEDEALAVPLRPLSGYLTVTRRDARADLSHFDRIVLLPSSASNRDSAVSNTPPAPLPPALPQQSVMVNGVARLIGPGGALIEDDQQDAPRPASPRGFSRGDPPSAAPQTQPPAAGGASAVGSSTPGIIVTPPPQQNPAAPVATQR